MSSRLRPARRATAAIAALLLFAAIPAASAHDDGHGTASAVTGTQAELSDVVSGDGAKFTWHFDYGTTSDYAQRTDDVEDPGSDEDKTVTATATGLTPGTKYHARLSWKVGDDREHGDDFTFTTPPAGEAVAPSELSDDDTPDDGDDTPPKPALAHSVVTAVGAGAVRVRIPGWRASAPLAATSRIPVGSVLDARKGKVAITSALADGSTQTATFSGGVFTVAQNPILGGLTDITLKPAPARRCATAPAAGARAAAARRLPPRELGRLWASDNHGKYRTHGLNSVATVRGTSWLTVERCDGTITKVLKGAVSVFDRRLGRRTLVHAGERYLARKR